MEISGMLSKDMIFLDIPGKTKEDVIRELVNRIAQKKMVLKDSDQFFEEVLERERLGSTGIGEGVAIPHARTDNVEKIIIVFARTMKPVDFNSDDKRPVRLLFMIAVPVRGLKSYLNTLAKISRIVRQEKVRRMLLEASSPDDVIRVIQMAENEISS